MSIPLVFFAASALLFQSAPPRPPSDAPPVPAAPTVAPVNAPIVARPEDSPPEEFAGCWQDIADAGRFLEIETGRTRELDGNGLRFFRTTYDVETMTRSSWGSRRTAVLSFEGKDLVVVEGELRRQWRRVTARPAALDPKPLPIGNAAPLAPERLAQLQAELKVRRDRDQKVRTTATPDPLEMERVDRDNTAWITERIAELGWIDTARFGRDSAQAAFLFVQHSGDLGLMLAALPEVERDFRENRGDPQSYALLHDRLQVDLGRRQRFGSQLGFAANGSLVVIALEDRDHVEQLRREIGMATLASYLDHFRKETPPKEVVFEDDLD